VSHALPIRSQTSHLPEADLALQVASVAVADTVLLPWTTTTVGVPPVAMGRRTATVTAAPVAITTTTVAVGAATARPLVDPWMTTLPQDLLAAATTTLTAGTTDRLLTLMVRLGHMIARHHPGISLLEMHREVAIRLGMRRTHLATMTAVVATDCYQPSRRIRLRVRTTA